MRFKVQLGVHRITGKRYSFVTIDGKPLAPTIREQIRLLGDPARVPQAYLDAVLARIRSELPRRRPTVTRRKIRGGLPSEKIKAAVSLEQFVAQYVELDEHGVGHCPFHDDHHASFQVNRDRNFWYCYAGCGGGSVIDFWMKWREKHGQDAGFVATITELAAMVLK